VMQEIKNKELAALPLVKGRIVRQWVVAHLKDKPLTLAERTFMGLCRDVGGNLGGAKRT